MDQMQPIVASRTDCWQMKQKCPHGTNLVTPEACTLKQGSAVVGWIRPTEWNVVTSQQTLSVVTKPAISQYPIGAIQEEILFQRWKNFNNTLYYHFFTLALPNIFLLVRRVIPPDFLHCLSDNYKNLRFNGKLTNKRMDRLISITTHIVLSWDYSNKMEVLIKHSLSRKHRETYKHQINIYFSLQYRHINCQVMRKNELKPSSWYVNHYILKTKIYYKFVSVGWYVNSSWR